MGIGPRTLARLRPVLPVKERTPKVIGQWRTRRSFANDPRIITTTFDSKARFLHNNQPDRLAGNEDCEQMSAWYVINALGFYAVDPVSGNYVFGTPLFDRASVQWGMGRPRLSKQSEVPPTINTFNRSNSMASFIQKCGSVTQTLCMVQPLCSKWAANRVSSLAQKKVLHRHP